MKTWKPATFRSSTTSAEAVDQRVGAEPAGRRKRLAKLPFLRRKRSDSPIPMRVETRRSFARLTTPGMPTKIGRRVPRAQTFSIHCAVTDGSKQIWLDDVRRVARLLEHRRDRRLVVDQRVALRVAGDPDLLERMAELVQRLEQRRCAVERPVRLLGVAGDDEDVAHADLAQPGDELGEVCGSRTRRAERCGTTA